MSKRKILILGSNATRIEFQSGFGARGQYLNETVVPAMPDVTSCLTRSTASICVSTLAGRSAPFVGDSQPGSVPPSALSTTTADIAVIRRIQSRAR